MEPITAIMATFSMIGGVLASAIGGWDILIQGLFTVMVLDVITGLAMALGLRTSPKTPDGGFSGRVFAKGIAQKVLIVAVVFIAVVIDTVLGVEMLRDIVILFYILEESMSIIENARSLGVPIPRKLMQLLDVLESEIDEEDEEDGNKKK